jgi:hypothetical protein
MRHTKRSHRLGLVIMALVVLGGQGAAAQAPVRVF